VYIVAFAPHTALPMETAAALVFWQLFVSLAE
jgi:hypothetical protein